MNAYSRTRERRPDNPILTSGLVSKFSFWYLRSLFRLGLQRPIRESDIYECQSEDGSQMLSDEFELLWRTETEKAHPKFSLILWRMFASKIVWPGFVCYSVGIVCRIIMPQCLGGLVTYFSQSDEESSVRFEHAIWFSVGIIMSTLVGVVVMENWLMHMNRMSIRLRQTVSTMIYRKAMRIPKSLLGDGINGRVTNLMSTDVSCFNIILVFAHEIWLGPLELALFGYLIYCEIGYISLLGLGFLLSTLPFQLWMARLSGKYYSATTEQSDQRIRVMHEIIRAIQIIKMYSWEDAFADKVDKVRKAELLNIRGSLFVGGIISSLKCLPRVAIFITLVGYVYFGNVFTVRQLFVVTAYFGYIYASLFFWWPDAISAMAQCYIAIGRIEKFLLSPENKHSFLNSRKWKDAIDGQKLAVSNMNQLSLDVKLLCFRELDKIPVRIHDPWVPEKKCNIVLDNATASWFNDNDGTSKYGILNVSLDITPGSLCAIVGSVGSGKSSLLQAILGELELDMGSIHVRGSLSYADQDPWLFQSSIRQNIIFVEEFDEARYRQVTRICALDRDFGQLPNGDQTMVGERGLNLSGGQRARINLARAVYRKADIYLLDDPLAAVDSRIGQHIFAECFQEFLKDKTCILVTNHLQYLHNVGHVVIMHLGCIDSQGDFQSVNNSKAKSILQLSKNRRCSNNGPYEAICHSKKTTQQDESTDENLNEGSIDAGLYGAYTTSVNSVLLVVAVAFLFLTSQISISTVDLLLAKWVTWEESLHHVQHENKTARNCELMQFRSEFLKEYIVAVLLVVCLIILRVGCFAQMCLRASRNLHDRLFRGISNAAMSFFHANSSGRILNRFANDINQIDKALPMTLNLCLSFLIEMLAILVIVTVSNYWLIIPTVLLMLVFYGMRMVFIKISRPIKRIEAKSSSPIFAHANATVQGLATIRVSGAEQAMRNEFDNHQDMNTSSRLLFLTTSRAFAIWLEIVCITYLAISITCFLIFKQTSNISGQIGLAITQIQSLISMCQWGMRQTAELENLMISVERVCEYANTPAEGKFETNPDQAPPPNWPNRGELEFESLSMKYSPNGANVLNKLCLRIEAQEKIGIIGRTGAGKSSIIQALFRLALNEGRISIDGVDISALGLHDLRRKISIIPQEPILFSGDIRSNLDPFGEHSDDDIWLALGCVELKDIVANGLSYNVTDGGSNFSTGQRQLICLARAMLRKNKILIMDEATANVDQETDRLIQKSIREHFKECTVLTIAHRLDTIMDSDRVLVIDSGEVLSFETPNRLITDQSDFVKFN